MMRERLSWILVVIALTFNGLNLLLLQESWQPIIQGNFTYYFFVFSFSLAQSHRFIHHEMNQPHKFAIAWTISRTLGKNQGGHFFNSDYGIRVMGGSDSILAWDPSHFHGTSLQEYFPSSNMVSEFYQDGLVCITPNRIPGLWEKYSIQQATLEQVKEGVLSDGDGDEADNNED
jgi:hypothetical protein